MVLCGCYRAVPQSARDHITASSRMATEAAAAQTKEQKKRREKDLTLTGLLVEGLEWDPMNQALKLALLTKWANRRTLIASKGGNWGSEITTRFSKPYHQPGRGPRLVLRGRIM
jgi:hypothetical protein